MRSKGAPACNWTQCTRQAIISGKYVQLNSSGKRRRDRAVAAGPSPLPSCYERAGAHLARPGIINEARRGRCGSGESQNRPAQVSWPNSASSGGVEPRFLDHLCPSARKHPTGGSPRAAAVDGMTARRPSCSLCLQH